MKELIEIQKELKAPKGNYNSFGKYRYRSAEDILESVKPLCHKNGCLLTLSDNVELIGERFYIKATAKITNGTESVEVTAYAREEETKKGMDGSQITGTASSYARKYALNGLFCIDDTKDADTDEFHKQTEESKRKVKESPKKSAEELSEMKPDDMITAGGADYLLNLAIEAKANMDELFKYYKVDNFNGLTVKQFEHCKNILEKRAKEQGI